MKNWLKDLLEVDMRNSMQPILSGKWSKVSKTKNACTTATLVWRWCKHIRLLVEHFALTRG